MVGGPYRAPQPQGTSHALTVTDTESSTNDVAASLHPGPLEIVYNTVHSFTLPSGQEVTVDRRSYMMDRNDQPLLYEVDSSGVPMYVWPQALVKARLVNCHCATTLA